MRRREFETEIARRDSELASLQELISALREACDLVAVGVEDPMSVARRALAGVGDQWDSVTANQLASLQTNIGELGQQLGATRSQLAEMTDRLAFCETSRTDLAHQVKVLEAQVDDLSRSGEQKSVDLSKKDVELQAMSEAWASSCRDLDLLRTDIDTLKQQLCNVQTERTALGAELAARDCTVDELLQDMERVVSDTQTIRSEAESLQVAAAEALGCARLTVALVARLAAALAASRHLFSHDRDTRTRILDEGGRLLDEARRWLETVAVQDQDPASGQSVGLVTDFAVQ